MTTCTDGMLWPEMSIFVANILCTCEMFTFIAAKSEANHCREREREGGRERVCVCEKERVSEGCERGMKTNTFIVI